MATDEAAASRSCVRVERGAPRASAWTSLVTVAAASGRLRGASS
ncbi:hypothetical protein SCE1572_06220 [Sorangium cellulosum So0157-2]|uniref:Uncharacterized protein n=1 Tax=Sorangium cellulosum So0157-2 TaxID=1254432 RepID=S4XNY0_SORCE|nr:hypothetical protein SCE1572_06220 [Sorangium cellulosum So0157-2]